MSKVQSSCIRPPPFFGINFLASKGGLIRGILRWSNKSFRWSPSCEKCIVGWMQCDSKIGLSQTLCHFTWLLCFVQLTCACRSLQRQPVLGCFCRVRKRILEWRVVPIHCVQSKLWRCHSASAAPALVQKHLDLGLYSRGLFGQSGCMAHTNPQRSLCAHISPHESHKINKTFRRLTQLFYLVRDAQWSRKSSGRTDESSSANTKR